MWIDRSGFGIIGSSTDIIRSGGTVNGEQGTDNEEWVERQ